MCLVTISSILVMSMFYGASVSVSYSSGILKSSLDSKLFETAF